MCKSGSSASPSTAASLSSSAAAAIPRVEPVIHWQFPLPAEQRAEERQQLLQAIIAQCNAATFGKGAQEVLDPSYRSAYQLPPSRSVTSLELAQPGSTVLADIARMLRAPARPTALPVIQAELYSLNIYTAGGLFRPHVDTPRADNMFGSLVVCLPIPHQGGQLIRCGMADSRACSTGRSLMTSWVGSASQAAAVGCCSSATASTKYADPLLPAIAARSRTTSTSRSTSVAPPQQQSDGAAQQQPRRKTARLDRRSASPSCPLTPCPLFL